MKSIVCNQVDDKPQSKNRPPRSVNVNEWMTEISTCTRLPERTLIRFIADYFLIPSPRWWFRLLNVERKVGEWERTDISGSEAIEERWTNWDPKSPTRVILNSHFGVDGAWCDFDLMCAYENQRDTAQSPIAEIKRLH